MRATWDATRLWALVPAAGGDIPGQVIVRGVVFRVVLYSVCEVAVYGTTKVIECLR